MTTTREVALSEIDRAMLQSIAASFRGALEFSFNRHDMAELMDRCDALSTPATEPQGYVEGPQFRDLKTCKGCSHFKSEYWREPSGDGETYDSGTSADCLKAGRSISTYYGSDPTPPEWCPLAARPAPQPAADTRVVTVALLTEAQDLAFTSIKRMRAGHVNCNDLTMQAEEYVGKLRAIIGNATPAQTYQSRVKPWLDACFGSEISGDKTERNHRFLEEALELVQSGGCTASEAHQLVDYVYGRPVGEMGQEIGGVMNTLAALCLANGFDMHDAGEVELARVWTKVEQIRAKQAAKPKHSPLPEHAPAPSDKIAEAARDNVARSLREYQMQGRMTVEWAKVPKSQRKKWYDLADVALRALAEKGE